VSCPDLNFNEFLPLTHINFNSKLKPAVIDTGANVNVVPIKFLSKKQLKFNVVKWDKGPIQTISNSCFLPFGQIKLKFKIKDKVLYNVFAVVKNYNYFILGINVIKDSGLILDLKNNNFSFSDNENLKYKLNNYTDKNNTINSLSSLSSTQQQQIQDLISEYPDVITEKVGKTDVVTHKIVLQQEFMKKNKPYPASPKVQEEIDAELKFMLDHDIIRPSKSEYGSPVFLRPKPNGKFRFIVDYRDINTQTLKDSYPGVRIPDIFKKISNARYISTADATKGYWQVLVDEASKKYTAFITKRGLFEFNRMPFGLKNCPATYQRLMDQVLSNVDNATSYQDDILIASESFEEHLQDIRSTLDCLRKAGITLNPDKCTWGKEKVKCLGHVVSTQGLEKNPDSLKKIVETAVPKNKKQLKSFLGLASWYRQFIPQFATITDVLYKLLSTKTKFKWLQEHQHSFEEVKKKMSDQHLLVHPDFTKPFVVRTDASNVGVGAVLCQRSDDGTDSIITCASKALSSCQRNYTVQEKELYGIIFALEKFKEYLEGYNFILETDNRALTFLQTMRNKNDRLMRWAAYLQEWSPSIQHIKGTDNTIADFLSRNPEFNSEEEEFEVVKPYMFPPTSLFMLSTSMDLEKIKKSQVKHNLKLLMNNNNDYEIINGIIYKKFNDKLKIVIPEDLENEIISEFHDPPHQGHFGINKTYSKIKNSVYFPNMLKKVQNYIHHCDKCQRNKYANRKPAGLMQASVPSAPGEILYFDILGPYTPSRQQFKYLLVTVDQFTKWVEIFPLKNIRMETVGKVMENEIFCRYGIPKVLVSDNGTNFTSKTMKYFCKQWNVKQRLTSVYHPQSNQTERVNRNIKTLIRIFVDQSNHKTWADNIASFRLALNSSSHESTGFTAGELFLNRKLRAPIDNVLEPEVDFSAELSDEGLTNIDFIFNRKENYNSMVQLVRSNLVHAGERQKKYYDTRRRGDMLKVGDIVVAKNVAKSDLAKGVTASFRDLFEDKPAKIVEKNSDLTYTIMYLDGSKRGPLHIDFLRRYQAKSDLSFPDNDDDDNDNIDNNEDVTVSDSGKEEDKEGVVAFKNNDESDRADVESDNFPNNSNSPSSIQRTIPNSPNPNNSNFDFDYDPALSYTFTNSKTKTGFPRFPRLDYKVLNAKGIKVQKGR